ncbi:MAG TPA: hypothetical protein VMI54_13035 [Polyangiaceae bacterium]|nr:hypothetical protein [Polyangiaceae bacterium]
MTTMSIGGGDDLAALAKLMLDVDDARAAADEQELRAAHETQRRELERQVQDLHEAANDVREGAWVEGGLGLVGGTVSTVATAAAPAHPMDETFASKAAFASAKHSSDVALQVGQMLTTMAKPTSAMTFGAAEKDAEARAKQHEAAAADAGASVAEAEQHRSRVLDNEERTLSTLQSTLQSAADGNLAIIANA